MNGEQIRSIRKEIEDGRTVRVTELAGGGELREQLAPAVEWESVRIEARPGERITIRGQLRDFDGDDRIDDEPGAVLEVYGVALLSAPIFGGIIAIDLVLPSRGEYVARLACSAFRAEEIRIQCS
jgi:hypothetical protein